MVPVESRISAAAWAEGVAPPPPATRTLPSAMAITVGFRRGDVITGPAEYRPVFGSNISVAAMARPKESGPPTINTRPSWSRTALPWAVFIEPAASKTPCGIDVGDGDAARVGLGGGCKVGVGGGG